MPVFVFFVFCLFVCLFVFLWESFEARKKRLTAPGSGSQTHKSLSTLISALHWRRYSQAADDSLVRPLA